MPSAIHEGISTTTWASWPDGKGSCKGGGPHRPDVKATLDDQDLMRFFE